MYYEYILMCINYNIALIGEDSDNINNVILLYHNITEY